MFINYKVMDYQKRLIGVTGVGVKLINIEAMLGSFKTKYKYDVYFVDQRGEITLFSKGLNKRGNIASIDGLQKIQEAIFKGEQNQFEYKNKDGEYLLNTKYIDKLKLHLFVEINKKEYMDELTKTFYLNLFLSLLVTLAVTLIIVYTINLYQNQLIQLASEDVLTGLANRRKFNEVFELYYKRYPKEIRSLTLLLIDIDDFKSVNDTFGHLVGDQTLVHTARILKEQLRQSDTIARWGGEEFAILLSDIEEKHALEVAQKICNAVQNDAALIALLQRPLSVSVGVGMLSALESQDGLVHKVDHALYEAKKAGKNQVIAAL